MHATEVHFGRSQHKIPDNLLAFHTHDQIVYTSKGFHAYMQRFIEPISRPEYTLEYLALLEVAGDTEYVLRAPSDVMNGRFRSGGDPMRRLREIRAGQERVGEVDRVRGRRSAGYAGRKYPSVCNRSQSNASRWQIWPRSAQ